MKKDIVKDIYFIHLDFHFCDLFFLIQCKI